MEESVNDVEVNQSFRSPPRRRRSTFFDRRESFVPQPTSVNDNPNVCKQTTNACEQGNEDLIIYCNKLLSEKENWKKEVHSRQNKYHDVRQQYLMTAKLPSSSRMSYSALTNEDIDFFKAKVNTSKLVESQLKLHKSLKETRALYRRLNDLDDVILATCEQKVDKVTEYILENSTINPKD